MRHLGSLLAGLVLAPAGWLLLAIGQRRSPGLFAEWASQNRFDTAGLVAPLCYLAVAGVLFGLLACLRISPAGPTLVALLYLGLYAAMFVDPLRVLQQIPEHLDLGIATAAPRVPAVNGTLAVLGACLLVAMFSRGRWQRPAGAAAEATPADGAVDGTADGTATDGEGTGDPAAQTVTGSDTDWPDSTPGFGAQLLATEAVDLPTRTPGWAQDLAAPDGPPSTKITLHADLVDDLPDPPEQAGRHSSPWDEPPATRQPNI